MKGVKKDSKYNINYWYNFKTYFGFLGTHKELISKPGMYRKLWNLQKGGYIVDENNDED